MTSLEEYFKDRNRKRDPATVKAVEEYRKILADIDAEEAKTESEKDTEKKST